MNNELKTKIIETLYETVESKKDIYSCCVEFTFAYAELENDEFKNLCRDFYQTAIDCLKKPYPEYMSIQSIQYYSDVYNEICKLYPVLKEAQEH